ncbi:DNA polymerase/3'-5' exonuclease PolX [Rhodohalobacter sp. 8-1]|uniref:DNA polymerase/3'-5' exonuclease PolX n=1 Tax=Rhodohalobacter sp. 8-1 TaxID=3131972 RepID=UPI0030EF1063
MPIHNSDVSEILREVADLLEIEGRNEFRVRAYRNAAQSVENLSKDITELVNEGEDLTEMSDIGESIAEKIEEIVKTGSLEQLQEIRDRTPEDLAELLNIEGLGPEKVSDLHEELGIDSTEDLKEALDNDEVRELEGFGKKTEEKIEKNIEHELNEARTRLDRAEEYAEPLVEYLGELDAIDDITVAGSYRRKKETVGDLDILVTCSDSEAVMDHFTKFEDVADVIAKGDTKSSVRLKNDLQVDLRVLEKESYGSALVYFTGSKSHNIELRERALDYDLKINEYGVFPEGEDESVAGAAEEEVYKAVDLPFIPPEIRENRGEIDAARNDELPNLIEIEDIRGDIHTHTNATDGSNSIEEMARSAVKLGYEYIAITDHSQRVTVANGLNEDELREHMEEIEAVNDKFDNIEILKGIEVDILEDGTLDLSDDVLSELDIVIGSVHYKFDLSRDKQTDRYLKALDNPNIHIVGHPTVREINSRDPMDVDLDAVFSKALENGVHMELNASPRRLDLNDKHCKTAKEMGLKIVINTDAHSTGELHKIKYGIYQARRAWLEKDDVINTRSLDELREILKR